MTTYRVIIEFEKLIIEDIDAEDEKDAEKIALQEAKWPIPSSVEVEEEDEKK